MKEPSKKNWLNSYLEQDGRVIFLALCIVQVALIFIQEDIIGFRADFFDLLEDAGETGILYWLLRLQEVGGYLIVPLNIFIQVFFAGLMLWIGTFTFGYKIDFKASVKITVLAYPSFFIAQLLKILWFGFINRNYSQFELDHFHHFSMAVFWPVEDRINTLPMLAKSLNPGLLVYLWLMTLFLAKILNRSSKVSWPIVMVFIFGIGLLWKVFYAVI
ncbi:hypothetical protein HZR84_07165 [Hyphobacterium sp. CCMP332]|nr:hypothetical protein HZR84_07165 [Hyphobacterium sp. CCMP332]